MYSLLRPLLFRLDPERAHALTLALVRIAGEIPVAGSVLRGMFEVTDARLEVEAFGVRFKNPVGLAAGYDKNGIAVQGLGCLGFGHIEVGTLTRLPQPGNARPRLHRVPEVGALINRMGFPNAGVGALKLKRRAAGSPRVGVNIGKGIDTPLERAAEDYCALLREVHAQADYVVINVSSPNTPGLRRLQSRRALESLLKAMTAVRDGLTPRAPLLVKVAPDLSDAEIDDILSVISSCGLDGVIATNTTVGRAGVPDYAAGLMGGLSGDPLRARSTEVIRYIARHTEGRLPIVGVGGIAGAAAALEKLRAGACLVQVFTGLVYAGPGLVRRINTGLLRACEVTGARGVWDLAQASL